MENVFLWENDHDGCQIDISDKVIAITYVNSRLFCAAQRFNQFNFGTLQEVGYLCRQMLHVPVTAHFMYFITKEKKEVGQALI